MPLNLASLRSLKALFNISFVLFCVSHVSMYEIRVPVNTLKSCECTIASLSTVAACYLQNWMKAKSLSKAPSFSIVLSTRTEGHVNCIMYVNCKCPPHHMYTHVPDSLVLHKATMSWKNTARTQSTASSNTDRTTVDTGRFEGQNTSLLPILQSHGMTAIKFALSPTYS
jgi:hypothetical protein